MGNIDETKNYTDVEFEEIKDDVLSLMEKSDYHFNAVQIGKVIGESSQTVRDWESAFPILREEGYVKINPDNGFRKYSKDSVQIFEFIRQMRREKNLSLGAIRGLLDKKIKQGQNALEVIDKKDTLAYEALATELMIKNKEMMSEFRKEMIATMEKREENLIKDIVANVNESVQEVIEASYPELVGQIVGDVMDKVTTELSQQTNSITDNVRSIMTEENKKTIEMYNELKTRMDNNKKDFEEKEKRKGIFSKLFAR